MLAAWVPGEVPELLSCPEGLIASYCTPSVPLVEYNGRFGITPDDMFALASSRIPETEGRGWWAIDEGGSAIDADNVVYTYAFDYGALETGLPADLQIQDFAVVSSPVEPEWDLAVFALVDGEVERFGRTIWDEHDSTWPDFTFEEGPYVELFGAGPIVCALAEDGTLQCNSGQVLELGDDIVEVDVQLPTYIGDDPGVSACALTTDNEIRCRGPHYPQDLQDQLDALPR